MLGPFGSLNMKPCDQPHTARKQNLMRGLGEWLLACLAERELLWACLAARQSGDVRHHAAQHGMHRLCTEYSNSNPKTLEPLIRHAQALLQNT